MIQLNQVRFAYDKAVVLQDVTGLIPSAGLTFLLGENGSGKTTLLKCLLRLLSYEGEILIDGQDTADMTIPELARRVAYIPQSHTPRFNFAVTDVVLMGVSSHVRMFAQPKPHHLAIAEAALDRLGILALKDRGYGELSGGERQLVLIARALAQKADILVMDEPTANLDFGNQIRFLGLCRELIHQDLTIIITSHQPQHALQFADHTMLLHQGHVLRQGVPVDVITEENLRLLYGIDLKLHDLNGLKIPVFEGGTYEVLE